MKIKILLLLLTLIAIKVFSQEEVIYLYPQKEYESIITLSPAVGKGSEVNLNLTVFWDNNNELIKVELKGARGEEKFIYFFPEKMFIKKQVMKLRQDIWFTKDMLKCDKGTVDAGINPKKLVNLELDEPIKSIRMLECSDKSSVFSFDFREAIMDYEDLTIPLNLYIATKETLKGERRRKVEYLSKFSIIVLLQSSCDDPDLVKVIQTLSAEIENMQTQTTTIQREIDNLVDLPCATILELPEKLLGKEKEITQIRDMRFAACDNLKKTINTYNEVLETRNKTIFNYNLALDDYIEFCLEPEPEPEVVEVVPEPEPIPVKTPVQPQTPVEEVNCRNLYKANEQLAELLLDVKNSKQPNLSSFKQEFDKIKKSVSSPGYKNCKSDYKVYESLCSKIENRFKQ